MFTICFDQAFYKMFPRVAQYYIYALHNRILCASRWWKKAVRFSHPQILKEDINRVFHSPLPSTTKEKCSDALRCGDSYDCDGTTATAGSADHEGMASSIALSDIFTHCVNAIILLLTSLILFSILKLFFRQNTSSRFPRYAYLLPRTLTCDQPCHPHNRSALLSSPHANAKSTPNDPLS